ncbi:MAG: hypothetical protein ACFFCO_06865 [Promethearchaeota archaeon]
MSPHSTHFKFYAVGRITTYFIFAVGVVNLLVTFAALPTLYAPLPPTTHLGNLLVLAATLAYAAISASIWSFPPPTPRTFTMRRLLLLLMLIVLLAGGALDVIGLLPVGFTGTEKVFIIAFFAAAGVLLIVNQIAWATYQGKIMESIRRERELARAARQR